MGRGKLLGMLVLTATAALAAEDRKPAAAKPEPDRFAMVAGTADQDASPQTRAVLDYFKALPARTDKRLVSGQFMGWFPVCSLATAHDVYLQTGQWVGVAGFDYYETVAGTPKTKPDRFKPPRWQAINAFAKAYWETGGLVTISCHLTNPWDGKQAWSTTGKFEDLLDKTTPAYARYREQTDAVAAGLDELQRAGVTVLFRPFHEMTGAWFWWGKRDPETFRQVWRQLFDTFTHEKGLHNLIWVWSPAVDAAALNYYPGNAYVDMTGLDIYAADVAVGKDVYGELKKTGKPFAVTEFGPPGDTQDPASPRHYDYGPFAKSVREQLPDTVFFLAWRDAWGLHRNLNAKTLLNDPLVVNRDGLDFQRQPK